MFAFLTEVLIPAPVVSRSGVAVAVAVVGWSMRSGFAKSFLGTDAVVGQVLYNEHRERIDLRFRKADPAQDTIPLLVTFLRAPHNTSTRTITGAIADETIN